MAKQQTLGARVRELRLAKQLSQRELAEKVAARLRDEDRRGFDFTYLSKIENDRLPHPPSAAAIMQLAAELEADSDELLSLAGKTPPDVGDELRKKGARVFFRSATNQKLSEEEWRKLQDYLEQMRGKREK